jgi:hypothetical protein
MGYQRGYEEESFLKQLQVPPEEVEFLADNCTKVSFSDQRQNVERLNVKRPNVERPNVECYKNIRMWNNPMSKAKCRILQHWATVK